MVELNYVTDSTLETVLSELPLPRDLLCQLGANEPQVRAVILLIVSDTAVELLQLSIS